MIELKSSNAGSAKTNGANRRLVLKTSLATLAALGAGGVSTLAKAQGTFSPNNDALTDVDILNFALNLEYLEAEYYHYAVYGHGLSQDKRTGTGMQGKVVGGSMVPFQNIATQQYATEIAQDELKHVEFLRAALGSAAVAEPSINLQSSFNRLAKAAGLGDAFDPFSSGENFLIGAFIFEDVGVTAYHGAAPHIKSKAYLDAAAGILAVEAYHASLIRVLCYQFGLAREVGAISKLRNKLSAEIGKPLITDQGIELNGMANIIPADGDGIAFQRTPQEVLNIVYAGGQSGDYGFFPNMLNGTIH
ncbi:MAG TPA: ferritin-like domain-containing protein [Rhizomicrobium sp.]